jgi:pimeloyl-ACP methyl ester carboxylesterase
MDYQKDFEDGFAQTSMGALHFMHHPGEREKIIFLHGIGSSTRAWTKLVQYLPDDLDVFLIDLLGHGKSDAPTDIEYTVSNQFQALREFIALQNNGDSYIFGHSYGGWIAAYYASQSTSKGIILEDAAGLKEYFDQVVQSGKMEEYKQNLLKSVMAVAGNKEHVFKSIIDSYFEEDQLTRELLVDIKARTKIIWGSNDSISDKSYAEIFLKEIKGSTLNIIEGAEHDAHYTHPKEVSDILLNFVNRTEA